MIYKANYPIGIAKSNNCSDTGQTPDHKKFHIKSGNIVARCTNLQILYIK